MFDKSAIMRRAWELAKRYDNWKSYLKTRLRHGMRDAWNEAKAAARKAKQTATDQIREAIYALECKDARWSANDHARLAHLKAALLDLPATCLTA